MVVNPALEYITPENYLEGEAQSPIKHEYRDGEIYAMAGASDTHVTIAGNLFVLLRNHLRGAGCRVYISDMKARIEDRNIYYYPDVLVTCDPRDRETPNHKCYPCLIAEVLSDSTEAFDRGDKFVDYQRIETLQEYVLISTTQQRVDCFRRNEQELWVLQSYTLEQPLPLQTVDYTLSLDALYEEAELLPRETS
jgi:Uma2 family endonuclease